MKPYFIILPFSYFYSLPLKGGNLLANSYNDFIADFVWHYVDKTNYLFAKDKHIKFVLTQESNCIFEGVLNEIMPNGEASFHSFKINSPYVKGTDFYAWDNLAICKSLQNISVLEFDFVNQWLSSPTEKFIHNFQQLPSLILTCHCTEGFHNFINDYTLKEELQEKLPNTSITINIV